MKVPAMLTLAGEEIPLKVSLRLDPDELVVTTVHGLLRSGLALTPRRLFAWRATGTSLPMPLAAIGRVLVDTGTDGDHVDLVVMPRQAVHPALVLTRRGSEAVSTLGFVAELVEAVRREPVAEQFGPVHRFTFPVPFVE
jgi:hypothetical protein